MVNTTAYAKRFGFLALIRDLIALSSLAFSTHTALAVDILVQPVDQVATEKSVTRFEVVASGNGPLSFQWLFDGQPLADARTSVLVVAPVQPADVGRYEVVIRDDFGLLTSQPAMLSLIDGTRAVIAWGANPTGETNVPSGLEQVVSVAAGNYFNLALRSDGTVTTWGEEWIIPSHLNQVKAIAAGGRHALALLGDGTIVGWGDNFNGQATPPMDTRGVVAIAGGDAHSLAALEDGNVIAWGNGFQGALDVPPGLTNVTHVAAGDYTSFALHNDGQVTHWGSLPTPPGLSNVMAITAGHRNAMALFSNGTVQSWGAVSTNPPGVSNVISMAAQYARVMAVLDNGQVLGWGLANAPPGIGNVVDIAAGAYHNVAIINEGVPALTHYPKTRTVFGLSDVLFEAEAIGTPPLGYQWQFDGTDLAGQTNTSLELARVGTGRIGTYSVRVQDGAGFVNSASAKLAVIPSGGVIGWGLNDRGQASIPAGLQGVIEVECGGDFSVALLANGRVTAWGDNVTGTTNVPPDLTNAVAIAAGNSHAIALKEDGTVVGWGYGGFGANTPPPGLSNVVAITAASTFSQALTAEGDVVTWGQGSTPNGLSNVVAISGGIYLLADGTVFTGGPQPPGLTNIAAIAGGANNLALASNGTVVAWQNSGDLIPSPLSATNIIAISAGGSFLALREDRSVVSWGDNDKNRATLPVGLTNVFAFSAGSFHGLAVIGPLVSTSMQDQNHFETESISFHASGIGPGPFSYQWQKDGQDLAGQTNGMLEIPNITLSDAGYYRILVTGPDGIAMGPEAMVTVHPAQPVLTRHPHDLDLFVGDQLLLRGAASGLGNLSYQWHKDGVPLPEETRSFLTLFLVSLADGGQYTLTVSNEFGIQSSDPAQVQVRPWPSNTTIVAWGNDDEGRLDYPAGLNNVRDVAAGRSHGVALTVSGGVVGWGDNTYGQSLLPPDLTNVVAVEAGDRYTLALLSDHTLLCWGEGPVYEGTTNGTVNNVVAIDAGPTHAIALLESGGVLVWGDNSYGQTNVPSDLDDLVAVAAGDGFSLVLRGDGTCHAWGRNDFGQTNIPPHLTNIVAIAGGAGGALVLDGTGQLDTWGDPQFFDSSLVPTGLDNLRSIDTHGTHMLALQTHGIVTAWGDSRHGNLLLPSDAFGLLTVDAGTYHSLATKAVSPAPVILAEPQDQTLNPGDTAQFDVVLDSSGPFDVAWYHEGNPLLDERQTSLVIPSVAVANAGEYQLIATGWGGAVTSQVAVLDLLGPPFITADPQSFDVESWANVTFDVHASGTPPFSYQWRFWGVDIAGATNRLLNLERVRTQDAGFYAVVVSNDQGMVESAPGQLNVTIPDVIDTKETLLAFGSQWSYLDDGSDQGEAWRDVGFDDAGWTVGQAKFGYGQGDEVTLIDFGNDPNAKHITTYFRTALVSPDLPGLSNVLFRLVSNDGGVVYLNGVEAFRDHMPEGEVGYLTLASGVSDDMEHLFEMDPAWLPGGTHLLAAEVHQVDPASPDMAFDLEVEAALHLLPPAITGHPQSQTVTSGSDVAMVVEATGTAPLNFQWYFNGAAIPGANNSSLILPEVQTEDVGTYRVRVDNIGDSVYSLPAELGVLPFIYHPVIAIARQGDQALFTWEPMGLNFVLEYATELSPTAAWTSLPDTPVFEDGIASLTLQLLDDTRFFRLRERPIDP